MMKYLKQLKNILLVLISLSLTLLVLEAALALFRPSKVMHHDSQAGNVEFHPNMGWINKPNIRGDVKTIYGTTFRRSHNGNGLRSVREIEHKKPAHVRRILLLGDSFIWGYGVNDEDVISEVLQRKLGKDVEVINGGVIGYGTDQEILWFVEEGLRYEADLVVLGFYVMNDTKEISSSISYGYPKPIFDLDGNELVLGNVPVPDTRETRRKSFEQPDTLFGKTKMFLRHHTHTYPFIIGRLNSVPALRGLFLRTGLADEYTRALPGVPYIAMNPDRVQAISDALIKSMRDIARKESGADFLLVLIPIAEKDPQKKIGYQGTVDWDNIYRINTESSRYFASFTKKNNIGYLDLLPIIRERHIRRELLYNPSELDHHWTALGHRVAADALYDYLVKTRWISASEVPFSEQNR